MPVRRPIRTWISGIALCVALIVLAAASWAQFQVSQRRGWTPVDWPLISATTLERQLQAGLDKETASNPSIKGQLFHIIAPSLALDHTFAAGAGVLTTDDIRVASNIKTFVAAGALRLVETGQLNLDAPIGPYLSPSVRLIMENGRRPIDQISLRHLLNHSSGIADYGSSRLFQALAYVPTASGMAWHWTPWDQIWFAVNLTPQRQVGAQFDYSDTNYLLASDMIAKAKGSQNAGIALRQLLIWPTIGAHETFWEGYEPIPANTRLMRHFRGAIEDTNLDVSFDQYGGGGLVMSVDSLAHAHRAVVAGTVFEDPLGSLAKMQAPGSAIGSNGYGLGIASVIIEGETCWSHGGRWGTIAVHCPRLDVTIARSWGQSNAGPDALQPTGPLAGLVRLAKNKTQ